MDCSFCKIVKREIETKFILETDDVVAFYDFHPLTEMHILIAPRQHISSFLDIKITHKNLYFKMLSVAQKLIKDYNLEGGYRIVFNGGRFQHIPHLHMHLLGGEEK
jgi:histidine triad (HIT) family protein